MDARPTTSNPLRGAVGAFLVLTATCVVMYLGLWAIDFGGDPAHTPIALLLRKEAAEAVGSYGEIALGVLGVAITVVAIIVELAANRYTPRITELFLKDPINRFVMSFFLVTAVLVVWVMVTATGDVHPRALSLAATLAISTSLLVLLPYFTYVFDFLTPTRVVESIHKRAIDAAKSTIKRPGTADEAQFAFAEAVEQLGDIALNSVNKKDKSIGIEAVEALARTALVYQTTKKPLPDRWFEARGVLTHDADFVAFHPDILGNLVRGRTWAEMKVMRQFQAVFTDSLHAMRDIAHLIAIRTRQLGLVAAENGDLPALRLCIRFLNTFTRASINARDVRTAYNLLNEYRAFTEGLLIANQTPAALEVAGFMKFYGQLAFSANIPFILESAAYDLSGVLETAHARQHPAHDQLLSLFLELDREPDDSKGQEASLRGVRKAQIKLATWYLAQGDEPRARRIFDDMRLERSSRVASIRAELLAVTEAEYWEVSDRGINFEYIPPERRPFLERFLTWFDTQGTARWDGTTPPETPPTKP